MRRRTSGENAKESTGKRWPGAIVDQSRDPANASAVLPMAGWPVLKKSFGVGINHALSQADGETIGLREFNANFVGDDIGRVMQHDIVAGQNQRNVARQDVGPVYEDLIGRRAPFQP